MIGRIRTVKPEIFSDEKLWDLSLETGLPLLQAFEGLWCYADREGRFEWRPRALKTLILPYWEGDFQRALEALERGRYVVRYVVDGQTYGVVRGFSKHQRVNQREAQSIIPSPPVTSLHVHASGEGNGRELNGTEGKETRAHEELPEVPGLELVKPAVAYEGLQPSRRDQGLEPLATPAGPLRHYYTPGWEPTKANQARGRELTLTDAEIWARWDTHRDKRSPVPFEDDERQFNRELAFAAQDKTTQRFKTRAERDDFETPGRDRRRA